MINLGDYIGELFSELTIARFHADLESIRIAEFYANHDLLKYLSIPRVRLMEINIDLPIVVTNAEDIPDENSPRGGLSPQKMRKRLQPILENLLKLNNVDLGHDGITELNKSLDDVIRQSMRPTAVDVDSNLFADKFAAMVRRELETKGIKREKAIYVADSIRKAARIDFIGAKKVPPRLKVGVTSSEIKEAAPESVVRISLKISEEGLEWTNIYPDSQDGGEDQFKLVPE